MPVPFAEWFWIELHVALEAQTGLSETLTGKLCIYHSYNEETKLTYSGQGVYIPVGIPYNVVCFRPDDAEFFIKEGLAESVNPQAMANWILISENTLVAHLNNVQNTLINEIRLTATQTGVGGAPEEVVWDAANFVVSVLEDQLYYSEQVVLNNMQSQTQMFNSKIQAVQDDTTEILDIVSDDDTGIIDAIVEYLGGILDTTWSGIEWLITSVEDTYWGIVEWFSGAWDLMLVAIQNTLKPALEAVLSGFDSISTFIMSELWSIINPIFENISLFGDVFDFFFDDFLMFLNETFEFSEEDIETTAFSIINVFKNMVTTWQDMPKG